MVARKGKGLRRKTRHKLQKNIREKGKIKISKWLQTFENGQKVCIKIDPSVHIGMPHPRFYGRTGEIIGKRGNCYEVLIKDGNKNKVLIVHPVHLFPI